MSRRILIFDSRVANLVTHRRPIIDAAVELGFQVDVCTLVHGDTSQLEGLPVTYHRIGPRLREGGIAELSLVRNFRRLVKTLNPDICHFMSIRAVLYGLLGVKFTRCQKTVSSITGLGFLFIDDTNRSRVVRRIIATVIRICTFRGTHEFVFQNVDDREALRDLGCLRNGRSHLIRGSGVDVEHFAFAQIPGGQRSVIFPGRYLIHKGIVEYVEAAKIVKQTHSEVEFRLAGSLDPNNPASVELEWLDDALDSGQVVDLGYQSDMVKALVQATIVCLPSYREGLPKALLEGAAVGRPLVTCDVPGCREVVENGSNGYLVPAKSATALADAIISAISNDDALVAMGKRSREMAERSFSSAVIGRQFVELYSSIS